MTSVLFWTGALAIVVGCLFDRRDRQLQEARDNLMRLNNMNAVDRAIDELFGRYVTEQDEALKADAGNAWLELLYDLPPAPGSLPMRPYDPTPHRLPSRQARHTSRNRLHRGF